MTFGVVIFPGSNCDRDMIHVLRDVMGQEVRALWHKDAGLAGLGPDDCIVLPGGFSYGDYLRTGAIARFSPVMDAVIEHAHRGGRVFGICNGFQVLCETGLLPGALLRNTDQRFICRTVHLRVENTTSLLTAGARRGTVLRIPIAHADGRYFAPEDALDVLKAEDRVIARYCDADGTVDDAANPNGSMRSIAGVCNATGNVAGMMPHPERAAEPAVGNTDGLVLLESLLRFAGATV